MPWLRLSPVQVWTVAPLGDIPYYLRGYILQSEDMHPFKLRRPSLRTF